jgi:acetolactate synthase-1/2/3 large subunit
VGIVTSGPGATNLTTGIAGAFYDSIPCIFITGQVSVNRSKGESGVRQKGFQETPIVEIVSQITKFSIAINDPSQVIPALEKAYKIAISARMGPVLIDIPDDIQRMDIDISDYSFKSSPRVIVEEDVVGGFKEFSRLLRNSRKPVLILGAGLHHCENNDFVKQLLPQVPMPVATTWGAKDMIDASNLALLGTFGTHGSRFANQILYEADLIISIGSRLDLKATGSPIDSFAPNAVKIMFDVDKHEISKFDGSGLHIDLHLPIDLNSMLFKKYFVEIISAGSVFQNWVAQVVERKKKTPQERRDFSQEGINPYFFVEKISENARNNINLVVDTGCAIAWVMQSWDVKVGQKIFHDFNNTAMGWSIPAAIASAYSANSSQTYCIVGDGSIMMSLGDLSNIKAAGGNVIIFLLNNGGYAMIKQTQDQWFSGEYFASDSGEDLTFPNFEKLANAFDFEYLRVGANDQLEDLILRLNKHEGVLFCEVQIQSDARVVPIVKFGSPNHMMEPPENFN